MADSPYATRAGVLQADVTTPSTAARDRDPRRLIALMPISTIRAWAAAKPCSGGTRSAALHFGQSSACDPPAAWPPLEIRVPPGLVNQTHRTHLRECAAD